MQLMSFGCSSPTLLLMSTHRYSGTLIFLLCNLLHVIDYCNGFSFRWCNEAYNGWPMGSFGLCHVDTWCVCLTLCTLLDSSLLIFAKSYNFFGRNLLS